MYKLVKPDLLVHEDLYPVRSFYDGPSVHGSVTYIFTEACQEPIKFLGTAPTGLFLELNTCPNTRGRNLCKLRVGGLCLTQV